VIHIGVLALQGSVVEHLNSLSRLKGVKAVTVKSPSDLEGISGLILPGGESTTIGKLMKDFGLAGPIVRKVKEGMPIWGTCAGMILMAKEVVGENYTHLGLMDISVKRNAYGSQLDSFSLTIGIPQVSPDGIPLVFIRAPWVERIHGNVEILAAMNNRIIAVQQNRMLATSFHPELTENIAFHRYFADMAKDFFKVG